MPAGSGVDTLDVLRMPGLSAGTLNALFVPVTNVSQYKWLSLYIAGGYAGLLVPQISFDGSTWLNIKMYPMLSLDAGDVLAGGFASVSNALYGCPVVAPFFQVIMSSYSSGTATGELDLYTNGLPGFQMLEQYIRTNYGDLQKNIDDIPVLASSAVSADGNSGIFPNNSAKGIKLYIATGNFGAGASNITVSLQEADLGSGNYGTMLTSAALSANSFQVLSLYPGLASVANVSANDFLPKTWRVTWSASNWGTGGSTLGISAALNG